MMRKLVVMLAMLALSAPVFANSGGEGNNTGCNGVGNPNSPCEPQDGGNGGGGNGGGNPLTGDQWQGQVQGQFQLQGQVQGQSQTATADATAVAGAVATGGDATAVGFGGNSNAYAESGTVTNSGNSSSTATVGDVTATVGDVSATGGAGGAGGDAVASAVVSEGAVQVAEGAVQSNVSYEYREVRQAPAIAQGSFAISGCGVAGNAGGSNTHGAAFLGFGWTPRECYKFMLAQAYQSIGEKKAVCDILKNTKVGKALERDGVELPECLPEVVEVIAVPVAPEPQTIYVEVPPAKISQ